MSFIDNIKRLYQVAVLSLDEIGSVIKNDFDPKVCSFTSEEIQEIKTDKLLFKKKWAYQATVTMEDILQDVLFVVQYLKYAKGYSSYLRAINEKANVILNNFSTLAYHSLPMIIKELKPMIGDYIGMYEIQRNDPSFFSKTKLKEMGRPKQVQEKALLTQFEAAKLFLALSNVKAIPSMSASALAEFMNNATGFHPQNSRTAMRLDLKPDKAQKKKIKDLLRSAIKEIDTF